MQPPPLAPEQAGLDGLAGELVVEAEDVGVALHQQPGVDGGPQPRDQVVLDVPVTAASRSNGTRAARAPRRR